MDLRFRDPIPPLVGEPVRAAPHHYTPAPRFLALEPSPQRVRVLLGDAVVADSREVMLLRGHRVVPEYAFPERDVRTDLLSPVGAPEEHPVLGPVRWWSIARDGATTDAAVWTADRPPAAVAALPRYRLFLWHAMTRWMVEDEEVHGHLKDPLHRVDVYRSRRHVRVFLGGETIADTQQPRILFETGLPVRYYIPREDVRMEALHPSPTQSACPYKGEARYFHARVPGNTVEDVAWAYPEPNPEVEKIRDLVCFFDERVDYVELDGEAAPKPLTPWGRHA